MLETLGLVVVVGLGFVGLLLLEAWAQTVEAVPKKRGGGK